ncbi:hypothetical protein [Halalkalicoccus tibetensis]|uniref:Uncharacterized protein n=1 Tax=Halalkalicoccus tibetensis TaxID=175632 RepID=A0ABD5UZI5_9EURY
MTNRSGVVEIEKRDGDYRVELRDLETDARIDEALVDGDSTAETTYKHVCKVRLPDDEPRIDLESGNDRARVVLRAAGRTCYRHELPTRLAAN